MYIGLVPSVHCFQSEWSEVGLLEMSENVQISLLGKYLVNKLVGKGRGEITVTGSSTGCQGSDSCS